MTATIRMTHLTSPGSEAMFTDAAHYDITVSVTGTQYEALLELGLWDRVQAGYATVATNEFGELIVYNHDGTDITEYYITDGGFYEAWELDLENGRFNPVLTDHTEMTEGVAWKQRN